MANSETISRRLIVKAFPFVGAAVAVSAGTLASFGITPAIAAAEPVESEMAVAALLRS